MKILICNPDKKEAKRIENDVRAYSKANGMPLSLTVLHSPIDAAAAKQRFEVAIIEMEMEEIHGKTLGKILSANTPYTKLIYTSSDNEDIDFSFDLNAVRYFKRPYGRERFFAGLSEAIKRLENETVVFELIDGDERVIVNKNDIQYIEIENRKTKVITKDEAYFSGNSIRFWQEHIHSSAFICPHKSFLVNFEFIEKYKRNQYVIMKNGSTISIARGKGKDFHNAYVAYKNLML